MSWSYVTGSGSGPMAMRLVIAGHPIEFVTADYLAGAGSDGRIRLPGLNIDGIQWSEKLDPASCKLSCQGFTAEILEDSDNLIGNSFAQTPEQCTYLMNTMTAATNQMTVMSDIFSLYDKVYIGSECMVVIGVGSAPTYDVTRAYRQTDAFAHYVDSTGLTRLSRPEVTYYKPSIEGQTVYLYAYGDHETGSGHLVWTGIVGQSPMLRNLTTWEIPIESIASILDQDLGLDLQDPVPLRGIMYGRGELPKIQIKMLSTAYSTAAAVSNSIYRLTLTEGFYETQQDWCDHINSRIEIETALWTQPLNVAGTTSPRLEAVDNPLKPGSWVFRYVADSVSPRWLQIYCMGIIDPFQVETWLYEPLTGTHETHNVVSDSVYYSPTWEMGMPGAGTVPRGLIGRNEVTFPVQNIVPIGGEIELAVGDVIHMKWPEFYGQMMKTLSYTVETWNTSTRLATVTGRDYRTRDDWHRTYTASSVPELTFSRTYLQNGSMIDFLDELIANAPDEAPAGRQPYMTVNHFNSTLSHTESDPTLDAYGWKHNRYYGGSKDIPLNDILLEESKLAGVIPSIGTDGRIVYVPWRMNAITQEPQYTINAYNNLSQRNLPGYVTNPYGMLNTVVYTTGFDPVTSEITGNPITIRDEAALSRNILIRSLKIEPRSTTRSPMTRSDVMTIAKTWLGVLGCPYNTVTITCPLSAINSTIGSFVGINVSQIPNQLDGGRGVSNIVGMVVGREVKPIQGTVILEIFSTTLRFAGYSPSSFVDTYTDNLDGTFKVYLQYPATFGYSSVADWTIGDVIKLVPYNTTGTQRSATITAVTPGDNSITIGSVSGVVPWASALTVEYAYATSIQPTQEIYCYIARSDNQIPFDILVPARVFSI